jgi:hypothetical protein
MPGLVPGIFFLSIIKKMAVTSTAMTKRKETACAWVNINECGYEVRARCREFSTGTAPHALWSARASLPSFSAGH